MNAQRIDRSELVAGQPLRWDIYGAGGELLLRKGHVLRNERQLRRLGERELYVYADEGQAASPAIPEQPSVVRMLRQAGERLHALLQTVLREGGDCRAELAALAGQVQAAGALQADVALLCATLDRTGSYAVRHSLHTAVVALDLARALGVPAGEREALAQAALAMNVGMLHYQEQLAEGGTLGPKMLDMVRHHPQDSVQLLRRAGLRDAAVLAYVLQHHEHEDGSGYPRGLRGNRIEPNAKLIALADRYCAQTGRRHPQPPPAAVRDIFRGRTVEPGMLALLIREFGAHPPGTAVRLVNGEAGIVVERGKGPQGAAVVASLVGPRGAPLPAPLRRDTGTPLQAIRRVLPLADLGVPVDLQAIWGAVAAP